jgi:hypothetical protein
MDAGRDEERTDEAGGKVVLVLITRYCRLLELSTIGGVSRSTTPNTTTPSLVHSVAVLSLLLRRRQ